MPRGAAVIEYDGKRGKVFRVKYVDADGTQVQETLGSERDGWTRLKAKAELRERLVRVDRKGYRRPKPLAISEYARTWFEEGKTRRDWKPQTVLAYANVIRHLEDHFGAVPMGAVRPRDIAGYTRAKLEEGFSAKTLQLHLNVLHSIFVVAKAEELVDSNPVEGAERPKVKRRRWRILQPVEVPAVARAFGDDFGRLVFLTLLLTGVRRFELLALRWRDLSLVEGVLRVTDSKSEQGIRSIAIPATLVDALGRHYQATKMKGDDELVFRDPKTGARLDPAWYRGQFKAALETAGIADYIRPFHDARHSSLTNGAAAGEEALELMTRAGHSSMATTKQYLHLAGTVFPDAARALEQRLLGGTTLYPPETTSADPAEPQAAQEAVSDLS